MTDWTTKFLVIAAVAFCGLSSIESAEARPAVRFTSSEPAMSAAQCLERARAALDAELFRVGGTDPYSVTGDSPSHSVVISCVPLGRRVLLEIFTASDAGSDPTALHDRIVRSLGADTPSATGGAAATAAATGGTQATGSTASGATTAGATGAAGTGTGSRGAGTAAGTSAGSGATAATTSTDSSTTGGGAASSGTAGTTSSSAGSAGASGGTTGGGGTTGSGGSTASGGDGPSSITLASEWHVVNEAAIDWQNDLTVEVGSARECLAACEAEPRCQSVDFNRSIGQCNLAFRTAATSLNKFHEHVCFDYYSRDKGDRALLKKSVFSAAVPPEYGTWRKTPEAVVYGRKSILREMPGTVIQCADACAADAQCKSFNHYPNAGECHLLSVSACEVGTDFWGNSTSAMYHYTQEGSRVIVEATDAGRPPGPADRTAWNTDYGDLTFRPLQPGRVTGQDPTGVGEIAGDLDGRTLSGHWIRRDGGQRCASAVAGSHNWGRIELVFDAGFGSFTGRFGFCDGSLDTAWNGGRQDSPTPAAASADPMPAPMPVPSSSQTTALPPKPERGTDTATWTVDYGGFEATADWIEAAPAGDGKTSYYTAPSAFVGDWSGYGTLVFEKKSWGGDYYGPDSYAAYGDIVLSSGAISARHDIAEDHSGEWRAYRVPLDASAWSLSGGDLASLLANVTELKIRAEYGAGTDYSSLRNVRLVP